MKVSIHAKGIDLLKEEKEYAENKIRDILHKVHSSEKKESIVAKYEIDKELSHSDKKRQFFCTLTLIIPGKTLRSEAHCGGVYTAIDKVIKCMSSQLSKEKQLHHHI